MKSVSKVTLIIFSLFFYTHVSQNFVLAAEEEDILSVAAIEKVNEDLDDRISFEYLFDNEQEKVVYSFRTLNDKKPSLTYNIKEKDLSRKEVHEEYEIVKSDFQDILEKDDSYRIKASIFLMTIPLLGSLMILFI